MFTVYQYQNMIDGQFNLVVVGRCISADDAVRMCNTLDCSNLDDATIGMSYFRSSSGDIFGDAEGWQYREQYHDESAGSVLTGREW